MLRASHVDVGIAEGPVGRAVDARKAAVDAQDELVRLRAEKSTGVKTDKGPLAAIGDFFKARARARRVAAVGEGS